MEPAEEIFQADSEAVLAIVANLAGDSGADARFVSPRRWEQKGVFKTALLYSLLNILFWLKISPRVIKKLYGDLR